MLVNRRRILVWGAGLGLVGAAATVNRAAAFGLGDLGGVASSVGLGESGGSSVDPAAFLDYLVNGTKSLAVSVAEMNDALGRKDRANAIRAYLQGDSAEFPWKQVGEAITEYGIAPEDEITANNSAAKKSVVRAWVFGSYGAFMDKKAYDSGSALASSARPDPSLVHVIRDASDAVQVLPTHIDSARTIVEKSYAYMNRNGIRKLSAGDAQTMVAQQLGGKPDAAAFTG